MRIGLGYEDVGLVVTAVPPVCELIPYIDVTFCLAVYCFLARKPESKNPPIRCCYRNFMVENNPVLSKTTAFLLFRPYLLLPNSKINQKTQLLKFLW